MCFDNDSSYQSCLYEHTHLCLHIKLAMGEMGVCVLMMVVAQIKTITRNNLSRMLQRPHIMRLIIAQQKSPES